MPEEKKTETPEGAEPEAGGEPKAPAKPAPSEGKKQDDGPSLENLRGENRRLSGELKEMKASQKKAQDRLRAALLEEDPGKTSSETDADVEAILADAPSPFEDVQAYNRYIARAIRDVAQSTAKVAVETYRQENETKIQAASRAELTNANVESFKADREWTGNPAQWAAFVDYMNSVVGRGPKGEITVAQLEMGERAVRGAEMAAEAASTVQARTIQGLRAGTRTPRGRPSSSNFEDLEIDEQMGVLRETDNPREQAKLFRRLKPDRRLEILERIDRGVQPREQY